MTDMASPALNVVSTGGRGRGGSARPAGPAKVIPFPILRRLNFLDTMAQSVAGCRDVDRYMAHILKQQREAMERRGIAEQMIQQELAALDRAFRSRLEEYA
jgi:hypothetical protein